MFPTRKSVQVPQKGKKKQRDGNSEAVNRKEWADNAADDSEKASALTSIW